MVDFRSLRSPSSSRVFKQSSPTSSPSARPAQTAVAPSPGAASGQVTPLPNPRPQPAHRPMLAPAPRPAAILTLASGNVAGRGGNHTPGVFEPIAPTCQVMKVDTLHGDPYESFMASVPDMAKEAGIDLGQGEDATRKAGAPLGVSLEKWTPHARYYNGVSDMSNDGRLEQHLIKHAPQGGIGLIYNQGGMQLQGRQQGAHQAFAWSPPGS